jgi:hypothetical protein
MSKVPFFLLLKKKRCLDYKMPIFMLVYLKFGEGVFSIVGLVTSVNDVSFFFTWIRRMVYCFLKSTVLKKGHGSYFLFLVIFLTAVYKN